MQASNKHDTAILIFALSSQEECRRKKIVNSGALFNALSQHSIDLVSKTGLPYFHYTEKEQHGRSFGERFTHAIESIFKKGYKHIITIGNDTPHLKSHHLIKTYELLKTHKLVVGPSADGGFYLMGLHKENFNKESFEKLPWQTSKLLSSLKKMSNFKNSNIFQLDRLFDIDTAWDLKLLSKFSDQLTPFIKKIIVALMNPNAAICSIELPFKEQFKTHIHQNKGSPDLFWVS